MTALQRNYLKMTAKYLSSEKSSCLPADTSLEEWEALFALAKMQKTVPWLVKAAVTEASFLSLPSEVREGYVASARNMVYGQMTKHRVFGAVCNRLSEEGIPYALLKGLVCDALYPERDYRITGDCDLLILPRDKEKASSVFLAAGMDVVAEKNEEVTFLHPENGLVIELHTALFFGGFPNEKKMNRFFDDWENRLITENEKIYTLSHTEHFVYLVFHAYKHFVNGGFGIRILCDIALYALRHGEETDMEQVAKILGEIRGDGLLANLLLIAEEYLQINGNSAYVERFKSCVQPNREDLIADLLEAGTYGGSTDDRKHSATVTLGALQGHNEGKAGNALFPNTEYMKNKYSFLRRFPFLLPVAWLLRWKEYFSNVIQNRGRISPRNSVKIGKDRICLMQKYGLM